MKVKLHQLKDQNDRIENKSMLLDKPMDSDATLEGLWGMAWCGIIAHVYSVCDNTMCIHVSTLLCRFGL